MNASSSHPPTPPQDIDKEIENALDFLNPSFPDSPSISRVKETHDTITTHTPPPSSPTPSGSSPVQAAEPPLKKIRFSPYTHEIADSSEQADESSGCEGRSPGEASRTRSGATKSILKRPTQLEPASKAGNSDTPSLPVVLDSAIRQLQDDSRTSRLDAYLALSGTLRVSQGRLDPSLLLDKIAFFEHCLRRDLKARNEDSGVLDINLITQAQKLAALLFRIPQLFFSFSRDFLAGSMSQTIESLTQTGVSKALVTSRLMFLVHTPLISRVGNSEQLNSLISALADLHRRVSGNNILILRLLMYRMLLYEASDLMLERINSWLPLLLKGMLSASTETRNRAIECATYAGKIIGAKPSATKALQHLLARDLKGQPLFSALEQHLCDLLSRRVDAIQVPKIWSALVLFFRSKQSSLSNWCYVTPWMKVIQRCFNSTDKAVSIQAYDSWKKLIYSIGLDQNTRPSMIKALRQPISSRLCLRAKDKDSRSLWEAAFSSYCTLLRYSFLPQASAEQIQMFWDNFVAQVLTDTTLHHEDHAEKACLVLSALFGDNEPLLQYLGARAENDHTPDLDVIACISPRWLRKNLTSVLPVVEVVICRAPWSNDGAVDGAVLGVWSSLMKTVSDAGAKEVKASRDLKDAIAAILNFLTTLWSKGPSCQVTPSKDHTGFRDTCSVLIRYAFDCLGPINFAGQYLSLQTDGKLEHETVSSDEGHCGTQQSPIHIIATLFSEDKWNGPWKGVMPSETANLLSLCLDELASLKGASASLSPIVLLQQAVEDAGSEPLLHNQVWRHLATLTKVSTQKPGYGQEDDGATTIDSSAQPTADGLRDLSQPGEQGSENSRSSETAIETSSHHNDNQEPPRLDPSLGAEGLEMLVNPPPTVQSINGSIPSAQGLTVTEPYLAISESQPASQVQAEKANAVHRAFFDSDPPDSDEGERQAVEVNENRDNASETMMTTSPDDPLTSEDILATTRVSLSPSDLQSKSEPELTRMSQQASGNFDSVSLDQDVNIVQQYSATELRSSDIISIAEQDSTEISCDTSACSSRASVIDAMEGVEGSSSDVLSQESQHSTSSPPHDPEVEELDEDTIRVAVLPPLTSRLATRVHSIGSKRAGRKAKSPLSGSCSKAARSKMKSEEPMEASVRPLKRALETSDTGKSVKIRRSNRRGASKSKEAESETQRPSDLLCDNEHLRKDGNENAEIHSISDSSCVSHGPRRRSARLSGVQESTLDVSETSATITENEQRHENRVSPFATECAAVAANGVASGIETISAGTILQQLRGVLASCKAIVFASSEAQEVDEIQWITMNIQKEVLEGKRRNGRQSVGLFT